MISRLLSIRFLVFFTFLLPINAWSQTKTVELPKSVITTTLNQVLASTKIVVDNYGSKKGTSWHSDQSYILLPNGKTIKFKIPEYKTDITKKRKWRHYINDLASQQINIYAKNNAFVLEIIFESQGEEIKGKCLKKKITKKWAECTLKMERDIQLNNARLEIPFKITARKGGISMTKVGATFKADMKIPNKLCQMVKKICNAITGYIYKNLKSTIESQVKKALSNPAFLDYQASMTKKALNNQLTSNLAKLFAGIKPKSLSITQVKSKGSNYAITVNFPDIIHPKSVNIVQFKPSKKNQAIKCPGNVEFIAAIKTDVATKGQVWIESLSPDKYSSKKQNWSMNKAGEAKSKLNLPWKPKSKKKVSATARLAVSFKLSNGKLHKVYSKPVKFTRQCQSTMKIKGLSVGS